MVEQNQDWATASPEVNSESDTEVNSDAPTIGSLEMTTRIEEREVTPYGKEIGKPLRDLYESGARLWTKEMLIKAERDLAQEPPLTVVQVPSMTGDLVYKTISTTPPAPDDRTGAVYRKAIHPQVYQSMLADAEELRETQYVDSNRARAEAGCAVSIGWSSQVMEGMEAVDYGALKSMWEVVRGRWAQSDTCRHLVDVFKRATIPKTTNKIVCFGLGTLEVRLDYIKDDDTSIAAPMNQHAAALTLSSLLGELLGTGPLPILAQDPGYSDASKRVLAEEGIEVLGGFGALGFTLVDENTVVMSIHPNIPVRQVVADIAQPAAMVWDRAEPASEDKDTWVIETDKHGRETTFSPWTCDHDSARTRKLVEDYDRFEFPKTAIQRHCFRGVEICVRKD